MEKYFQSNVIVKKALLALAGVLALAVMIAALVNAGRPTVVLAETASVMTSIKEDTDYTPAAAVQNTSAGFGRDAISRKISKISANSLPGNTPATPANISAKKSIAAVPSVIASNIIEAAPVTLLDKALDEVPDVLSAEVLDEILSAFEEEPAEELVFSEFTYDDGSGIALLYNEWYEITDCFLTADMGVVYFNDHKETYYSENVLPGDGLDIPDRHVADDGTVRDVDGYICVAADPGFLPYGATVLTSLGPAKVYDCGCDYGTVDIYVSW